MPSHTSSSPPSDDRSDANAPAQAPSWRSQSALTLAIGVATALALAIVLGLVMTPKLKDAEQDRESAAVRPQGPAQFTYTASKEAYQPPSAAQVTRAYAAALTAVSKGGASELARQGLLCFRGLETKPTYGGLDYCIALDLFGRTLNTELAGEPASPTSWFGSVGARHHNAAEAILGGQGDAEARILDLDRMVGRQPSVKPVGADPAVPARIAPTPMVAAQSASTTAAPSAPRTALRRSPPLASAPPVPPPSASAALEPRVRSRASDVSPSFDCRFARSLSERQICSNRELAEADVRLDRAYREAAEAGVPERELRRGQDRWLAARERNGDDVEALGEIYEQRIEELEDLAR